MCDVTTAYVAETAAEALCSGNQDYTTKSISCERPDVTTRILADATKFLSINTIGAGLGRLAEGPGRAGLLQRPRLCGRVWRDARHRLALWP